MLASVRREGHWLTQELRAGMERALQVAWLLSPPQTSREAGTKRNDISGRPIGKPLTEDKRHGRSSHTKISGVHSADQESGKVLPTLATSHSV